MIGSAGGGPGPFAAGPSSLMRRSATTLLACAAGLFSLLAVALHLGWANGPSEWQWAYREEPGLGWEWILALAAALCLVTVAALAGIGGPRSFARRRGSLAAAVALGLALTFALLAATPGGFRHLVESTVSRHSFGYLFDAGVAPPTRELLADWPAASSHLFLHSRTHPPGPLLAIRALDHLLAPLGARLDEGGPGSGDSGEGAGEGLVTFARKAYEREVRRASDRRQPVPVWPTRPLTTVVLILLLPACSALAAWPLHRLALALGLAPETALTAAVLWLLVPARSLFSPSFDQALPLGLLTALWLAARPGAVGRVAAGLLAWGCCFTSYGYLVTVPLAAVVALGAEARALPVGRERRRSQVRAVAALGVGFLAPWIALAAAGFDAPAAFRLAIAEHRGMAVAARTYSLWLRWDLYDFALLLGAPLAVLAVLGTVASRRRPRPGSGIAPLLLAAAALLGVVWISGSVRGEVGRIWLAWMPFACAAAALALEEPAARRGAHTAAVVAMQAALLFTLAANLIFIG